MSVFRYLRQSLDCYSNVHVRGNQFDDLLLYRVGCETNIGTLSTRLPGQFGTTLKTKLFNTLVSIHNVIRC